MATLFITEYSSKVTLTDVSVALEPGSDSTVSFTTSTASSAFADTTRFIRVVADAKAHIAFGTGPTATASNKYIAADTPEYFGVSAGHKIAAYDGTS